jgi:RNA polymerase sigma factor (sigma-70 family)
MQGEDARERPVDTDASRDAWLAQFVDEHGDAAYRTAYRLLGDRHDARDAVQDALTTAFSRWNQLRSPDAGRGWLFRILVNECITRQRRRRVREGALRLFGIAPTARFVDPSIATDFSDRILPHLLKLPAKQRTALILRFGDDRSVEEIAGAMGIGTESVKTHLKRGLAGLRLALGPEREGGSR